MFLQNNRAEYFAAVYVKNEACIPSWVPFEGRMAQENDGLKTAKIDGIGRNDSTRTLCGSYFEQEAHRAPSFSFLCKSQIT